MYFIPSKSAEGRKEGRKENYTPLGKSPLLQKTMDSYFENPIPLRPGPFGYLPISCEDSRADTINKNLPKSQRSNGKNLENLPSLKPPDNGWLEYDCFLYKTGRFSGAFAVSFRECKQAC